MRTIKRMMVYHRNFCDTVREKLEQWLCKEYHATKCVISDGTAHMEWFAGACGDTKDVNVFITLFRSIFTDKTALAKGWKEIAEHWILAGISVNQVEKLMGSDMIDIADEFFEYAAKVEKEYREWCEEQVNNPWI